MQRDVWWKGVRWVGPEHFFLARFDDERPAVHRAGLLPDERANLRGHAWVPLASLRRSPIRCSRRGWSRCSANSWMLDKIGVVRESLEVNGQRLPHVDNVKTALVAWVIGAHALLGYTAVGGWPYDEVNETTFAPGVEIVLAALIGPSGLFVIGGFFFLAGLFTPSSLEKKGLRRFTLDRMLRLGLPWATSAFLIWPLTMWLAYRVAGHHESRSGCPPIGTRCSTPARCGSRSCCCCSPSPTALAHGLARGPGRTAAGRRPAGRARRRHRGHLLPDPARVPRQERPDLRPAPVAVAAVRGHVRPRRRLRAARLGPRGPRPAPPGAAPSSR